MVIPDNIVVRVCYRSWLGGVALETRALLRSVREIAGRLDRRRRIEVSPIGGEDEDTWHAREVFPSYSQFQGGENRLSWVGSYRK